MAISTIIKFSVSENKSERHVAVAADASAFEFAPVDVNSLEHRDCADPAEVVVTISSAVCLFLGIL